MPHFSINRVEGGIMRFRNLHLVLAASVALAGSAMAQETTQPPTDAPAPAEAAEPACKLAQAPGRLIITMPTAPVRPVCATLNNCSKQVAEKYNAGILTYNKSMTRINEATADYVDALNDYARAAGRYTQCEIDRLNEQVAAN
jgi:hypothetical protein